MYLISPKKNPGEEGEPPSQGASKPQVNRSIHHLRLPITPSGCTSRRLCPPHFHQCAWCTTERFLYRGGWIKPSECEWKMGFIFTQLSWWRVFWNIWTQLVQDKWINDSSNLHFPEMLPERFPTLLQEKMSLLSLRTAMKFQEQWTLSQQNKARDTSETFKALMTFHYIDWFIGILIMAYHNTYVYITG